MESTRANTNLNLSKIKINIDRVLILLFFIFLLVIKICHFKISKSNKTSVINYRTSSNRNINSSFYKIILIFIFLFSFSIQKNFAQRAYTSRITFASIKGDVIIIGNSLLKGANAALDDNATTMTNVDLDGDATTTTNSSSATLSIPPGGSVSWAGLYWAGRSANFANRNKIKFKKAGLPYSIYTATQLDNGNTISGITAENNYQGFINVTAYLQTNGSGVYWAGDLLTITGNGSLDPYGTGYYGGWSLIVVYADNTLPFRKITVYDGYNSVWLGNGTGTQTVSVSGYITPSSGVVTTKLGMISWDGDNNIINDKLRLISNDDAHNITNASNPVSNYFNGTISNSIRNPSPVQNWGVDFDYETSNISLPNNSSSTNVYFNTSGDFYIPGAFVFAVNINSIALPIELAYFNASLVGAEVKINWETESEINNNFFTVEKSIDGNTFSELEKIQGAGNSVTANSYSSIDSNPYQGVSYYRLKQTDYDGMNTFSEIKAIDRIEIFTTSVYPIPFQNTIHFVFESKNATTVTVSIFNLLGEKIYSTEKETNAGVTNIELNNLQIPNGVYNIILDEKNVGVKKLGPIIHFN